MIGDPELLAETVELRPRSWLPWRWVPFHRWPVSLWIASGLVLAYVVIAIFAPEIQPANPMLSASRPDLAPRGAHWLGTDTLGRDVLSRLIEGSRYTLIVGLAAAGLSLVAGTVIGGAAGYAGGWIDDVVARAMDVFLSIPRLFLIILLVTLFGASEGVVIIVIGATMWPVTGRLMRSQALVLRHRGFVEAARVCDVPRARIFFSHVMPNGISPVIANATLQVAEAILLSAGLSFLSLGDPSTISWGGMIQEGEASFQQTWWLVVFPGAALSVLLLSLHVIGDHLGHWINRGGR